MRLLTCFVTTILVFLILGCSGSNPVSTPQQDQPDLSREIIAAGTVELDPSTMTINLVDDRDSAFHYNVTSLLAGACPGGCFKWRILSVVGNLFTIELKLENPISLQVYDARIVFTELSGKIVENYDGYSDVFNANHWKPFIAFAKGSPSRAFPVGPGGIDIQELKLRWPAGAGAYVSYFIEVSLGGNCKEPFQIDNQKQIGELTPEGGDAKIQADILDHQSDVTQVFVDTRVLNNIFTVMVHLGGDTWEASVTNSLHAPLGTYSCLIVASSTGETYKLYDFVNVMVTEHVSYAWSSYGGGPANTGRTLVFGPETNHLQWHNDHVITGDFHTIGAPVIDEEGNVYYHVTPNPTDGMFYKVNGTNGSTIWTHNPDDDDPLTNKELYTVPALDEANGYVYYTCQSGVWCVNMETGAHVNHKLMASSNLGSSVTVGLESVFFGFNGDAMYSMSPDLSVENYAVYEGTGFGCAPAVDEISNAFFPALGTNKMLFGVDYEGNQLFAPPILDSEAKRGLSALVDDTGVIYYQTSGYKLYGLNPNGTIKCSYFNALPNTYYASPVLGFGRDIYIFREKMLYAVDKITGTEHYSYFVNENGITPLVDGAERVYFMTYSGIIHCFDTVTRTDLWTYDTGRPLVTVPVYRYCAAGALGPDGTLVFMGNGGVWAIKDL